MRGAPQSPGHLLGRTLQSVIQEDQAQTEHGALAESRRWKSELKLPEVAGACRAESLRGGCYIEKEAWVGGSLSLWPNTKLCTYRVRPHMAGQKGMTREERNTGGAMIELTEYSSYIHLTIYTTYLEYRDNYNSIIKTPTI